MDVIITAHNRAGFVNCMHFKFSIIYKYMCVNFQCILHVPSVIDAIRGLQNGYYAIGGAAYIRID